jgi:hypothetical protein
MRSRDQISADAEEKRPFSNGTEFDVWADDHCYACVNDSPEVEVYCPILTVALQGHWPVEWTRRMWPADDPSFEIVDGCTDFEERRDDGGGPEPDPTPLPEVDGQLDIVDAYLSTALGELTPRTVPA